MASWKDTSLLSRFTLMSRAACEGESCSMDRVGNPICESCEEDRKASDENSKMLEKEPCFTEYGSVQKCMKDNAGQTSRCMDVWKSYTECRKAARFKQLGIAPRPHPIELRKQSKQRFQKNRESIREESKKSA